MTFKSFFPIITFVILLNMFECSAQYFQGTIGKSYSDIGNSILYQDDGSYIIAGTTSSFGNNGNDIILTKINKDNEIIWSRLYGGKKDDILEHIELTSDNNLILVGSSNSFNSGNYDVLVLNIDSNGETKWANTYGGSNNDFSSCIKEIDDIGYIISGRTQSFDVSGDEGYLIKIDLYGNLEWSKTYGTSTNERFYYVSNTSDNGFIITGIQNNISSLKYDQVVIKTNSFGDIEFSKNYGDGNGNNNDASDCIRQTADGGYAFSGHYQSYGNGGLDLALTKINKKGDVDWGVVFGNEGDERAWDFQILSNQFFLLTGYTTSFTQKSEGICILLTELGEEQWSKIYGGRGNEEFYESIIGNNEAILVGFTESFSNGGKDILIIKTSLEALNDQECNSRNHDLTRTSIIPQSRDVNQTVRKVATKRNNVQINLTNLLINNSLSDLCPIILPVKIIDFSAIEFNNNLHLNWHTVMPDNLSHFVIEASHDAKFFYQIDSIKASQNQNENEYNYSFFNTHNYKYFRLKIIDNDNSYERSSIITYPTTQPKISIYPNPFNNEINLENLPSNSIISLSNNLGVPIFEYKNYDQTKLSINTSLFPSSLFFIKILTANEELVFPIIKQF